MSLTPKLTQIHPNTIRQLFFLAILIFLGLTITKELYFMIGSLFGAITLYVIMMTPMKYLIIVKNWKPWLTALILMLISLVVMILPMIYLTSVAFDKITPIVQNPSIIDNVVQKVHIYLLENYQLNLLKTENVNKITEQVIPMAQKTLGGTFSALGNLFLMYLILYFLLVQTQDVSRWLRHNIPFKSDNVNSIVAEIRNLVYTNAIGIPMVALIQGVIGLVGYWIFGVEEFILMGILTAFSSVIPLIGTMVIYIPLAVFQFVAVGTWQGIGVALWGFIIIGAVDNIARFLIQKKLADVHPLITLLGVILGVNLFGFIGIIFGPLLLSVFFSLIKIYVDEFTISEPEEEELEEA
jgi:predicted PurR-regulated permease PerM